MNEVYLTILFKESYKQDLISVKSLSEYKNFNALKSGNQKEIVVNIER